MTQVWANAGPDAAVDSGPVKRAGAVGVAESEEREITDTITSERLGVVTSERLGAWREERTVVFDRSAPADQRVERKALLVAVDAAVVFAAALAAVLLATGEPPEGRSLPAMVALAPIVWFFALVQCRLYSAPHVAKKGTEIRRIFEASALGLVVLVVLAYFANNQAARPVPLAIATAAAGALVLERSIARAVFNRGRDAYLQRRVVLVGNNGEARQLGEVLEAERRLGYEVVGRVPDRSAEAGDAGSTAELVEQTVNDTLDVASRYGASTVIIAATSVTVDSSNRLIRRLSDAGLHVEVSSTLFDVAPWRLEVRSVGNVPMLYVAPVSHSGWRAASKRLFDAVAASVGLLVAGPVLLVAAALIKLEDGGPVFFRQSRLGRDGVPFGMLKLRSMVPDAEARLAEVAELNEADGPLFKVRDDPRITRIGRFIRKTSIDELPQLWNVVRGDMSLVGPRPALEREAEHWSPAVRGRLRVRPGITGMWQVHGRSESSFDDYARLDLYYVDNWSLLTDIEILLKTVPAVVRGRGAC
jgi:exopolysaccharide biosynthesis polyprenyl glycosylphosphotransferase